MNVLIVLGPFSIVAHYRALKDGSKVTIKWELKSAQKRLADGTRLEADKDEVAYLDQKLHDHISEAILNHYLSPDEFEAWFKTQDLTVQDGGIVTFEDCIALARAAYGAAHEIKPTDA